ncbi:MAG: MFS transporter [Chloroflexota bacterium]
MTPAQLAPAHNEPTNAEKIRRLPWSIASNAANTVFVQFTFFGSAFVLFLNQLGVNNSQIGLLLSLFPLFGMVALFIAPSVGRFGYKRTFLIFYSTRKIVTVFLLFIPWVLAQFGNTATLYYLIAIVIIFALCRAVAETALYPWKQEYVPDSVRGKFAATTDIYSRLTGVAAAAVGGYIISRSDGIDRFMVLIGIGVVFGFLSAGSASFRPGGASTKGTAAEQTSWRSLLPVLRDKNLLGYLLGFGFITLVTAPVNSFLPLFMQDEVGLSTGVVVWLQTGTLIGGLITTYLWGWAADRYGSKPVMLSGIYLKLILPLGWLFIPQNDPFSLPVALTIALVQGIANVGWIIGSARLLYVAVVPPEKKTEYMAVYYAAIGVFGGLSQLIGGRVLDLSAGLDGQFGFLDINPFTPVFLAALILPIFSLLVMQQVRADNQFSVGDFVTLFAKGNPFAALGTLPRYYMAKDEKTAVTMTERLGQTKSPLTVEELLDALNDPRFNVRFEAIISMARMPSDPRLIQALRGMLTGTELSLTVVSAWALGRMGDEHALKSLRDGLDSDYRSIRAHCARALGALGDKTIIPLLLQRLAEEPDIGLQMAYASTLGKLEAKTAVYPLLNLLETVQNSGARRELALSLARIIGNEQRFITLLRESKTDAGTAFAQAVVALEKRLSKDQDAVLSNRLHESSDAYARQQLEEGNRLLGQAIEHWLDNVRDEPFVAILKASAVKLRAANEPDEVYTLLALHTLADTPSD